MKSKLILSLILMTSILSGCASQNTAELKNTESKQIVDIILNETPDAHILSIRGNQPLTYSEEKQSSPKDILIYFPDTSTQDLMGHFRPPANDFINYIKLDQWVENDKVMSFVYISLAKKSMYEVAADSEGLQVIFPRSTGLSEKILLQTESSARKLELPSIQQYRTTATTLSAISTESLENRISVNVKADGTIAKYKDFTMVNPDRIVFDLYAIKSPHHGEQKITVQSNWIKRIRYYGHPDKLRLVIETRQSHLSKYSSVPTDTGLMILIYPIN